MPDYSFPRIIEKDLPKAESQAEVTHVRVVTDNLHSKDIEIDKFTLPEAQITGLPEDLAELDAAADLVQTNLETEILARTNADTINYGKAIEMIAYNAAAPSPVIPTGTTKTYEFSTGGTCAWLSNQVVEKGDKVTVAFTAPSTFMRTYQNVVSRKVDDTQIYNALDKAVTGFVLDARQGKVLNDNAVTAIADQKAMSPSIAFNKRVAADSGLVIDKTLLHRVYTDYLKQLPETKLLFMPEVGVKERTVGLNKYGIKMYSLDTANTDAVQLTNGTQPYMTVNAAPNSRKGLKFLQGQTQTGLIDFTDVSFAATDSWTLTLRIKTNSKNSRIKIGTVSRIYIQDDGIRITDASGADILFTPSKAQIGRICTIEFIYSNGRGVIKINGIPQLMASALKAVTFNWIESDLASPSDGVLYFLHLTNTRISESQSQLNHAFLSTVFPEIEGIAIGNQFWATENYEGTVDGAGNVIANVTDNSAWANSTVLYDAAYAAQSGDVLAKTYAGCKAAAMWCYYNNDPALGAIYGKLYNWYAVYLIWLNPPRGWRVPSNADFNQLVAFLGGGTVAGGKMKAKFGGFDNGFASNESGMSLIAGGRRNIDGSFDRLNTHIHSWSADKQFLYASDLGIEGASLDASSVPGSGRTLRLLRNEPTTPETLEKTTGYVTNNIGVTPLDITALPFGNSVMFLRVLSETAITGFQAVLYTGAGSAKETLCTGIAIASNEPKYIPISVAQSLQLVDFTVRVSGTKTDAAARVMYNVGLESAYKNMI